MKRATLLTITVGLLLVLTAGMALAANIVGTNGGDRLKGTPNADTISGRGGNDRVAAAGGADTVHGNDGVDFLYGEGGSDTMYGDPGDDLMVGAAGNDTIFGGPDDDRVRGVDGNDEILVAGDASNRDYVNCGNGTDTARVDSNDVVDGVVAETLVVNTAQTCERIFVNGIMVPTG